MTSKHPRPDEQKAERPDDLDENPGIGQSKGLFGRAGSEEAESIAGESTVEGDVGNDSGLGDSAPRDLGRTNE